MNVAFTAFLLVLLILPGALARTAYRTVEGAQLSDSTVWAQLPTSVLLAILIHAIAVPVGQCVSGYEVRFDTLLVLLASPTSTLMERMLEPASAYPGRMAAYAVFTLVVGWAIGYLLQWVVLRYKLDLRFRLLAFNNPWFYLFKGRRLGQPLPQFVYVSAVVEQAKEAWLYYGIVRGFSVRDNALQRIQLGPAWRRSLPTDRLGGTPHDVGKPSSDFVPINLEELIIEAADCRTIGAEYMSVLVTKSGEVDAAAAAPVSPTTATEP